MSNSMRQITFYKFQISEQRLEKAADGRYDLVTTPICIVEDTSLTNSSARAAVAEHTGQPVRRGTDFVWQKVGKVTYRFTTEDLLSIVSAREEVEFIGGEDTIG